MGYFSFTGVEVGIEVLVGRLVTSTVGAGVQVGGKALIVAVGVGVMGPREPGGGNGLTGVPGLTAMRTSQMMTTAVTESTTMDILSQSFNFIPAPSHPGCRQKANCQYIQLYPSVKFTPNGCRI
jgi:hypothetical protein